jgi:methyl coenzyme M reductase subunit D
VVDVFVDNLTSSSFFCSVVSSCCVVGGGLWVSGVDDSGAVEGKEGNAPGEVVVEVVSAKFMNFESVELFVECCDEALEMVAFVEELCDEIFEFGLEVFET